MNIDGNGSQTECKTTVNPPALFRCHKQHLLPHHHSQPENHLTQTPLMHCYQYGHKKRRWHIVLVCTTTLPHCNKMLQVLWYKQKQFMRASGHRGAFWQLCCAESWLWFLALNVPSALRRRQEVNRKKSGCGIKRLWRSWSGNLIPSDSEKQFLHMFHENRPFIHTWQI